MSIGTIHNRIYDGIILGVAIRGSIAKTKTFRFRKGNGFFNAKLGTRYQDQYNYFLPTGYATANVGPARQQWIAAVHKWKYDLTTEQKQEYNTRAAKGLRMSGYNLFMRKAMKGLIEMFVDRGDAAAYDFVLTDLTTDETWRELDLSAIVPSGAKAVLLTGHLEGGGIDWTIKFRKNGQSNEVNHEGFETIRAGVERHRTGTVACDANRKIQYYADDQAWTTLALAVRGWWT